MSDVEKLRFFYTDFLHNSLRMTIQNITFHSSSLPLNDAPYWTSYFINYHFKTLD